MMQKLFVKENYHQNVRHVINLTHLVRAIKLLTTELFLWHKVKGTQNRPVIFFHYTFNSSFRIISMFEDLNIKSRGKYIILYKFTSSIISLSA